jgi:hypothetical protein
MSLKVKQRRIQAQPLVKQHFSPLGISFSHQTNTSLGACGQMSDDSSPICAIGINLFQSAQAPGSNPNDNPNCGRKVVVTHGIISQKWE